MEYYCVCCGRTFSCGYQAFCNVCQGMLEVRYDLSQVTLPASTNPYQRFADLLPVQNPDALLPSQGGYSPLVHAKELGKLLGLKALYLKDETVHPTGSTKDRMATVALAYLWEHGVRDLCMSSTGNSSTAYAYAIEQYPEMHLNIFTGEDFANRVDHTDHGQVTHHVLRNTSFAAASAFAKVYAQQHQSVVDRGFFNIGRREGLKLAYLEACDQSPLPFDWYFQAVSSAMGVVGAYKGAKELWALGQIDRLPRLVCAQQASCAPMVQAWQEGAKAIRPEHIVAKPYGIAEAILLGDPTQPYPYVRDIVLESNGCFVAVQEQQIREARRLVEELEGISICFSSATAVAALLQMTDKDAIPPNDAVLINLTGRDRQPVPLSPHIQWYERVGNDFVLAPV